MKFQINSEQYVALIKKENNRRVICINDIGKNREILDISEETLSDLAEEKDNSREYLKIVAVREFMKTLQSDLAHSIAFVGAEMPNDVKNDVIAAIARQPLSSKWLISYNNQSIFLNAQETYIAEVVNLTTWRSKTYPTNSGSIFPADFHAHLQNGAFSGSN
ncbi:hypothetical protein [Pseudovibrio sp. FO-BEG1]|uniref:hypothetical protein n=1 Tax=Pseudovibrio sp. (strain FO-BEG1) TaxID=911045 RepID=UPI00059FD71E|nr:hypothetical protein [Pseudovibrio sp. FO-BEG1]